MQLVNLEERTEWHKQLAGRGFPPVTTNLVADHLRRATFLGAGAFCRVWRVESWGAPSPAHGQPVAIKVCSAGFKQLNDEERRNKQRLLQRHWMREVNAHLLLEGQPRVVRVLHTFQGKMMVPLAKDDVVQQPQLMEVVGLVEELCNRTSLFHFTWSIQRQPLLRPLWPVRHIAAEFAALMEQVDVMDRMGLAHQDIKLDNIMVHIAPGAMPVLKLGDLNGMQWKELTRDGLSWIGTVSYLPRRVRRLYLGEQRTPATGVGELNYDTYQMGKTLCRALLEHAGIFISYAKGTAASMEEEEVNVKGAMVGLLSRQPAPGEIDTELLTFGVLIALEMCWDEPYSSAADQLRLLPGEAAQCLRQWAALCQQWTVMRGGAAFWGAAAPRRAMAQLYLRLVELARLPPLDKPLDPEVHVQECAWVVEVVDNFWSYGPGPESEERLGPVRQQVAAILQERRELAAAKAAAQAAAVQMAVAEAERRRRFERPSHRSTAWESKVALRAEKEAAFLEGSTEQDENVQPAKRQRAVRRKAAAAPPAAAAMKRKPAMAAKPAEEGGQGNDLLVLSTKLRLKDIWGDGARAAADQPQLLGDKYAIAVVLAETIRVAAAAAAGADAVALWLSKRSRLTFSVSKRGSVTFSRREVLALAKDAAACKRFNAFVAAALAAWQQHGREGSQAERLGLIAPLQAAS